MGNQEYVLLKVSQTEEEPGAIKPTMSSATITKLKSERDYLKAIYERDPESLNGKSLGVGVSIGQASMPDF